MLSITHSHSSGAHAFALQNSRNDILKAYGIGTDISTDSGEPVDFNV